MYRLLLLSFSMLMWAAATIQTVEADIRGKVTNNAGKPIAKAIVSLVHQGLKDTTGTEGTFQLVTTDVKTLPLLEPKSADITLYRSFLDFSLPEPSNLKVEVFDLKGNLLKSVSLPDAQRGFYRFDIEREAGCEKLLVVRASIGRKGTTLRYLPLNKGKYMVKNAAEAAFPEYGKLAKITAVNDTLKVTANGYLPKSLPINSYDLDLTITLDTAGGSGGVRPSPGCGKEPSFKGEKRFTINVTAGGTGNRDYIIRLPDDYDKNYPYALWFAIHCLNGTADGVAKGGAGNNYEYYGMWKLANPAGKKSTTIFCSPQGISNAWDQGAKDLEFFRAMINKFENELCIDMSRIFASGFSMGGSMSYALACAMPDTFRAVCMHSGGSMSGCDQKKRGPVPMFITHGTKDNVCTYSSFGIPQLKDLAQRNGCTAMDIPSMVNPTSETQPQCVDYKNCNPGYPCRACIFKGSHTPSPGGEKNTWVDDSTWSWFKQFY